MNDKTYSAEMTGLIKSIEKRLKAHASKKRFRQPLPSLLPKDQFVAAMNIMISIERVHLAHDLVGDSHITIDNPGIKVELLNAAETVHRAIVKTIPVDLLPVYQQVKREAGEYIAQCNVVEQFGQTLSPTPLPVPEPRQTSPGPTKSLDSCLAWMTTILLNDDAVIRLEVLMDVVKKYEVEKNGLRNMRAKALKGRNLDKAREAQEAVKDCDHRLAGTLARELKIFKKYHSSSGTKPGLELLIGELKALSRPPAPDKKAKVLAFSGPR